MNELQHIKPHIGRLMGELEKKRDDGLQTVGGGGMVALNQKEVELNGSEMKEKRKDLGMTQNQVARKVGVTEWTYRAWERDGMSPAPANLKRLKEVLGVGDE